MATKYTALSARDQARIRELIDAAHEAYAEGLLRSTSGNLSVRLDGGLCAITASGSRLGQLTDEDIVVLGIEDRELRVGLTPAPSDAKASVETPMHTCVYSAYPQVGSVLHCQSPAATYLACQEGPLPDLNLIPEFPAYIRKAARVPFCFPGTDDLGEHVVRAFQDPNVRVVELGNHGQLVIGEFPARAVLRAVFFELACKIYTLGDETKLRRFSVEEIERLQSYLEPPE